MNTFKVDRLHPQGKTDICTEEPTYIAVWYNIVYLSRFFFLSFCVRLKKKLRQTLFCSISPVLFRYFANHPGALRVNVSSRRLMVSQCHCHSHPSTSAPTCPSSPPPPQAVTHNIPAITRPSARVCSSCTGFFDTTLRRKQMHCRLTGLKRCQRQIPPIEKKIKRFSQFHSQQTINILLTLVVKDRKTILFWSRFDDLRKFSVLL